MKLKLFLILVFVSFFAGIISCSNKPKVSRKPVAKITFQSRNNRYVFGDSVFISIQIKTKNGELKKSELYIDNKLVKTSDQEEFSYSIPKMTTLGRHPVRVHSVKTDRVSGDTYTSFDVVSDIIPQNYGYKVVKTYPHNEDHFTQGLEIHNNKFYESTGLKGKSAIYQFDLNTGKVLKSFKMEDQYFGEGITIMNNKIYQLTYKAQKGFVYDLNTFARLDTFTYETHEGWGLAHNNKYLIKTDSSEFLTFLDPKTFEVVKKIQVWDNQNPIKDLNELEYHNGVLYANVWTRNIVVKIDPETGKVLGKINFEGLHSVLFNPEKPIDVLNGIAINPADGKMYITGKLWPQLYEVKLIKKD